MKGDKLERQGGSGSQKRNHEGREAWETRRQRQPRAKSGRETSLGDKLAAAAKSEIMKEDKLGKQGASRSQERSYEGRQAWGDKAAAAAKTEIMRDKAAAAAKSETMKGDKLGRQAGSGSQERNHEGRQAWETSRQRQPRAKSRKKKFGRPGDSGSQERSHEGRQS